MKVLFVTHYIDLLGANLSMLQLIRELKDKKVEIEVLLPSSLSKNEKCLKSELQEENIPFYETHLRTFKHPSLIKVIPNYIYHRLLCRDILKMFKGKKYDIIHTNTSITDIGKLIAQQVGAKHVWHMREFGDLDYNYKTPFGKWLQKYIYSGQNHFIAISKAIQKHFSTYVGNQPISLIYNGIKPPKNTPILPKPNSETLKFCLVGYICPSKGQFDAIKAINKLVNHRKITNLHLSIIGSGPSDYLEEMQSFVSVHNLEEYISFLGHRHDVNELLKTMDVGLTTSYNEAFGRVTIEYMMNHLAVIASDGGANLEIITDDVDGFIYPAGNDLVLADKMQCLITDNQTRKMLAEKGFEKAMNNFSSTANSDNIFRLYQSIL